MLILPVDSPHQESERARSLKQHLTDFAKAGNHWLPFVPHL
jgi:hypothetical protein